MDMDMPDDPPARQLPNGYFWDCLSPEGKPLTKRIKSHAILTERAKNGAVRKRAVDLERCPLFIRREWHIVASMDSVFGRRNNNSGSVVSPTNYGTRLIHIEMFNNPTQP
eukprot:3648153-Amphidinium_carterae.1